MWQKIFKSIHHKQQGMSGLTTAIILIAFVTVASVMCYSVLSAGLFSTQQAKATVYQGVDKASGTLDVSNHVLGLSPGGVKLQTVVFQIRLAIPNETIDTHSISVNFWDNENHAEGCATTIVLSPNSPERGTDYLIEQDEQFIVTVTIPDDANVGPYETFSVQLLSSSNGTITITRTLPAVIQPVMDLQ